MKEGPARSSATAQAADSTELSERYVRGQMGVREPWHGSGRTHRRPWSSRSRLGARLKRQEPEAEEAVVRQTAAAQAELSACAPGAWLPRYFRSSAYQPRSARLVGG